MNEQTVDPIQLLRAEVDKRGSFLAAANAIGISESFVSLILSGKRGPGDRLLTYFGLEKRVETKVTYVCKSTPPKSARRKKPDRASTEA